MEVALTVTVRRRCEIRKSGRFLVGHLS
jgi:hypothetical protein